jgi:DNA-3-methyladenine glycosylase
VKLDTGFYARDARVVARALVGMWLCHENLAGRIVETEAYLGPHDLASHARFGDKGRSKVMFGPPGVAYVYLIYGMHECFNVVTGEPGQGEAVLIRALEPAPPLSRCDGPGRLTKAMGIDRRYNGHRLQGGALWIEDRGGPRPKVVTTPRIGVAYAGAWADKRLRYVDARSRSLSVRLPTG